MRILPQSRWITDKTRFAYDGLKCQRLYFPLMRTKDRLAFHTSSWGNALKFASDPIANVDPRKMAGIIGQFVDLETISIFKNFLNKLGISGLCIQEQSGPSLSTDLRAHCMPRLGQLEKDVDLVMLVGANPRLEASSFNVNLRRLVLRSTTVVSIGPFTNLTYKKSHFGNGMKLLFKLVSGKGPAGFVRNWVTAGRVAVALGFENVRREDGDTLMSLLNPVFSLRKRFLQAPSLTAARSRLSRMIADNGRHSKVLVAHCSAGERYDEVYVLHLDASTPAACELGGIRASHDADCFYLIGADSDKVPEGCWTIYQGHHGDAGARRATIILPSTAYSEKNGTYISLYHSIQQTKAAVQRCGEARDDCKIIQALADILFVRPCTGALEETWPSPFSISSAVGARRAHIKLICRGHAQPMPRPGILCGHFTTEPSSSTAIALAHDLTPGNSRSNRRLQHIRNPGLIPPFDNSYLPDVMGRASKTMGKCASRSLAPNFGH